MRRLAALALLAAGCQGSGGAASVRWRITDLTTGQTFPRHVCTDSSGVVRVHAVRIVLSDPATGAVVPGLDNELRFQCSAGEGTTPFILPVRDDPYSFELEAYDPDRPELGPEGLTPPPILRSVHKSEIVSLDIIEIGLDPPPPGRTFEGDAGTPF